MTFQDMYNLLHEWLDKPGEVYFEPFWADNIWNSATKEWLDDMVPKAEIDEQRRQQLTPLRRRATLGAVDTFNESTLSNFYRMEGVWARFAFEDCDGGTEQREVPVVPKSWDQYNGQRNDPDMYPTNAFPIYLMTGTGTDNEYLIKSDTVPLNLEAVYLRTVPPVDSANNPSGEFALSDDVVREILEIATRIALARLDQEYQEQLVEEQKTLNS